MADLYNYGIKESNYDVIPGLKRPLAAEIGTPPFPTVEKVLTFSEMFENRR